MMQHGHSLGNGLNILAKFLGFLTVAVPPHGTSQNCSNCGQVVKRSYQIVIPEQATCDTNLQNKPEKIWEPRINN